MTKRIGVTMKPLTEGQKAYIAGILDGEGCIHISRKTDKTMRYGYCYRLSVSVTNTSLELLEWLRVTTDLGSVTDVKHPNPRAKPYAIWSTWSLQSRQLLEACLPYMIVKKDQATLAIEFSSGQRHNEVGRMGLSTEEWERQAQTHEKMKVLNQRGKKSEE